MIFLLHIGDAKKAARLMISSGGGGQDRKGGWGRKFPRVGNVKENRERNYRQSGGGLIVLFTTSLARKRCEGKRNTLGEEYERTWGKNSFSQSRWNDQTTNA